MTQTSSGSSGAISAATRFRQTRKLPGRTLGSETLVVDPQHRKLFSLNAVGALVWSAVEHADTEADIVAAVQRHFRVDETRARADVDAFLLRLEQLGLAIRDEPTR